MGILRESIDLLNKMAPYLLFGFFFAGILHIFLSPEGIARHLGRGNFSSVIKAALFGIPLPLCSCGVVPAALSLRKEGASRGSVLAFLISTPATGIDSIFATYALMGGLFTAYRVLASFITAVFAGILANIFTKEDEVSSEKSDEKCKMCHTDDGHEGGQHNHTIWERAKGALNYAFVELLGDVSKWLLLGILVGGAISWFIPEAFITRYLGSGLRAMVIMFLIGAPMYVCATGSIPIAAALMLKGINPGAAFVFLLAGPATNAVTMTIVSKYIGKKAVAIYLVSIAVSSIGLGLLLDRVWNIFGGAQIKGAAMHSQILPLWVEQSSAVILILLITYSILNKIKRR
ncbi:MAG: SO_0444 family Cu/Zn efflux transporter [Candidatus Omnitrophica bacterium]|nr:SO_0444 family Cu/Zn efflux transporter [Candidatus Omnitrophota bacterium]